MKMYPELNAEMARKGITQKELSDLTGISVSSLSLKLTGKVKLTFGDAIKIKRALKSQLELEALFKKKND